MEKDPPNTQEVDWNECFRQLEQDYRGIRLQLMKEARQRIEHTLIKSIALQNYPPHIEIGLVESFDDKYVVTLSDILKEVGAEHELRADRGRYNTQSNEALTRRKNVFGYDAHHYVLRPFYDRFRKPAKE